ncbi:MAG TPA: TraX family protein [Lachnospiraceae bacterium]|nr:TraX family protein [Lachnospiraceae bacterium]
MHLEAKEHSLTGVKPSFGLSGSTLKIIAMVSMLIDHIGAAVLMPYMEYILDTADYETIQKLTEIYEWMRRLGRFAFPIFCFLLVEGFFHTKNVWKYAGRLFLFALISEVPFDLAFFNEPFRFAYQNVFFTLFFGLCTLIVLRAIENNERIKRYGRILLTFAVIPAAMLITYFLKTDYDYKGILSIVILYLFCKTRIFQMVTGALSFSWEFPAPLSFILLWFYNGKRGWKMKYIFYIFYPLHLLILYLVRLPLCGS